MKKLLCSLLLAVVITACCPPVPRVGEKIRESERKELRLIEETRDSQKYMLDCGCFITTTKDGEVTSTWMSWYKKVTQYFRRPKQVIPTITVHEFPLRDDPAPKVIKIKRKLRRNPKEISRDPALQSRIT